MKKSSPKVSVIMPSLNVGKYIREALTSVCNQTLKDIEIICVDAGSTDGTLEVIKEFSDRDSRIRLIMSDMKSYGRQMNLGIQAAQGDYIGIVETDDAVSRDMYERMSNVAIDNDLDVLKADYIRFEGELESPDCVKTLMKCAQNPNMYGKVICPANDLRSVQFSIICGNIYKRTFLVKNSILFNETPGASYQDIGFYMQTSLLARRIYFLGEAFYLYRRDNPNSSINNKAKVYAVCTEFDFIRRVLFSDASIRCRYGKILGREMFFAYWSTLARIGGEFRAAFVNKFSDDLKAAYKQGEISRECFSQRNWVRIIQIMSMPLAFLDAEYGSFAPLSEHMVVSLTTWPKRIATVHKVIDNMLQQNRRPDKIVLYLAEAEFPGRVLPETLKIRLARDSRFEVRYVDNTYSHKKYLHVFKDFPESVVVLVDDDIVYPDTMLRELMVHYRRNPHAVICFRSHTLVMTNKRQFAPYLEWMKERKILNKVTHLVFPTTGGGTLFPPKSLPVQAFDVEKIRSIALTADDLWIKWHLMMNGVPVKYVNGYGCDKLILLHGTQQETLCSINVGENKNDKVWQGLLSLYPDQANLLRDLMYECYAIQFPGRLVPMVSWPVRKFRGFRKCLAENGCRYTFFHAWEKLFGKLNQICRQLSHPASYWTLEREKKKRNKARVAAMAVTANRPSSVSPKSPSNHVAVSVIIPVYNAKDYVRGCLDSILRQSLKNIEVIAIDDGSKDVSFEILKGYAARDARVRCFTQQNSGASNARNLGMLLATGKFVCFVDPDDFLPDPKSIETLYTAAEKWGVSASCGSLERFDPMHPEKGIMRPSHWQFPDSEIRDWSKNPFEFCYQLFIFKREMLMLGNIRFPDVSRFQDPPFMVRAMAAAKRYCTSSVIAYRYRLGHQQINWRGNDYKKLRDMLVSMKDVVEFALRNGLPSLVHNTITRLTVDYRDVLSSTANIKDFPEWQQLVDSVPSELRGHIAL